MITRRSVFGITAAVVLFLSLSPSVKPYKATETLPGRLTDDAFWKVVTGFSEEGGYFRFENFLSNELGFQTVIPALKEIANPGGVYLGVGPEQNFTYISALQPKIAFIIDIRRHNMIEHLMYKALFELSSDRADFLSRLYARKRPAGVSADVGSEVLFAGYEGLQHDARLAEENLSASNRFSEITNLFFPGKTSTRLITFTRSSWNPVRILITTSAASVAAAVR